MWKYLFLLLVASTVFGDSDDGQPSKKLCIDWRKVLLSFQFLIPDPDEMTDDEPDSKDYGDLIPVGDMLLSKGQYDILFKQNQNKRVGYTAEFKRWPKGIVPIRIKKDDFSEEFIRIVKGATRYIMDRSCIQFKFDFNEAEFPDYVFINIGNGKTCSSQVGNYRKGKQQVLLHEKCTNGSVVHELLHTLGFLHMHTAPNRDKYVQILFDNIKPVAKDNFKQASGYVGMFRTPYDYQSIMHYR